MGSGASLDLNLWLAIIHKAVSISKDTLPITHNIDKK